MEEAGAWAGPGVCCPWDRGIASAGCGFGGRARGPWVLRSQACRRRYSCPQCWVLGPSSPAGHCGSCWLTSLTPAGAGARRPCCSLSGGGQSGHRDLFYNTGQCLPPRGVLRSPETVRGRQLGDHLVGGSLGSPHCLFPGPRRLLGSRGEESERTHAHPAPCRPAGLCFQSEGSLSPEQEEASSLARGDALPQAASAQPGTHAQPAAPPRGTTHCQCQGLFNKVRVEGKSLAGLSAPPLRGHWPARAPRVGCSPGDSGRMLAETALCRQGWGHGGGCGRQPLSCCPPCLTPAGACA